MKEGWKTKTLDTVASIYNGNSINADYKKKHFLGLAEGYPFIATKDVAFDGTVDYNNGVRIPFNTDYKIAEPDSVFICVEGGSAGRKIAYIDQKVCFGNKLFCVKPLSSHFVGKFVYYFLISEAFQVQFRSLLTGLIGGVSAKKFKSITISYPPLPDQQRIVSYLDAEFAKIEALKANAEKQLQAAKDLFQAALKELLTPKEGWVEKKLGDLCSICGEYGLNESATNYNGVRYLRITDITDDGELNNDKVSAQNKGKKNQEELEVGDILFARTGATVGKTLVYRKEFGKCVFAGYLIRYRTNPNIILPQFLFYYTHSTKYYDWVKNNQAAAAQPNISAQKYNCLIIAFPKDTAEQQRIADRLDALSANVKALQTNYAETITLCNDLKQALLKKVFG